MRARDTIRFSRYRKPERGIRYLIAHRFLEGSAQAVARFLLSRKGLSRQMIGEYLGNLQDPFAMQVLQYVFVEASPFRRFTSLPSSCSSAFVNELDFRELPIDVALRKFQSSFRLPVRNSLDA